MDALLFTALVEQIRPLLEDSRVQRIDQPSAHEVWLHLRKPGQTSRLVIKAGGDTPALYLSTRKKDRSMPKTAPVFCMLLRRRLVGAKITCLSQPPTERLCRIEFSSHDDFGDPVRRNLIIEIMGNRSNVVLTDEDMKIAGVLRPIGASQNRYRQLLPSLFYVSPPPIRKTHPEELTENAFFEAEECRSRAKTIIATVAGFDTKLARLACERKALDPDGLFRAPDAPFLAAACRGMWEESQSFSTAIVCTDASGRVDWYHVLSPVRCENRKDFESISEAIEHATELRSEKNRFETRKEALLRSVSASIEKTVRRVTAREADLKAAKERVSAKHTADLLLTYLKDAELALSERKEQIRLLDPATGQPLDVRLDISLSASANVQRYYRQYTKSRAAQKSLLPQIENDRTELEYLLSVRHSLEFADSTDSLEDIARELGRHGITPGRRQQRKPQQSVSGPPKPERFITSAGDEVLMGRNNRQNDYLSFKLAKPEDLWFHARGVAGAHVVLRSSRAHTSEQSIIEAAVLAASFSANRASAKVDVDCTRTKHVRKRPGGKPGMVLYEDFRTYSVAPDPDVVGAMRARANTAAPPRKHN